VRVPPVPLTRVDDIQTSYIHTATPPNGSTKRRAGIRPLRKAPISSGDFCSAGGHAHVTLRFQRAVELDPSQSEATMSVGRTTLTAPCRAENSIATLSVPDRWRSNIPSKFRNGPCVTLTGPPILNGLDGSSTGPAAQRCLSSSMIDLGTGDGSLPNRTR